MDEQKIKAYYAAIVDAWKTIRPLLQGFPMEYDPEKKAAYVRDANTAIRDNAAKHQIPFGGMLAIISEAEIMRIGYGCVVHVELEMPDGSRKKLRINNTDLESEAVG